MFTRAYETAQERAGHMLVIESMATKLANGKPQRVEFYSYLENYGDNFNSTWNVEDVFGRMDGIANYINTKRTITLSFKIPAVDWDQAKLNMHKVSQLVRFLYPGIESGPFGNIRTAPVIRLRFGNLIQDVTTRQGLYGIIEGGVSIVPMKDAGYFTPIQAVRLPNGELSPKGAKRDESTNIQINSTLAPKVFDISFTFRPLHNHLLGHVGLNELYSEFAHPAFPYGFHKLEFDGAEWVPREETLAFGSETIDTNLGYMGTEGNPNYQSLTIAEKISQAVGNIAGKSASDKAREAVIRRALESEKERNKK